MDRFWNRVKKTRGCWIWTGVISRRYGALKVNGRTHRAHRFSWVLRFGEIPEGLFVCHHCDNPVCVRPDHLFLGTPLDNMRDKIAKGRAVNLTGDAVSNPGESNPAAKLNFDQVKEIRRRYNQGGISQVKLGKLYGINQQSVSNIVRNQTWKKKERSYKPAAIR